MFRALMSIFFCKTWKSCPHWALAPAWGHLAGAKEQLPPVEGATLFIFLAGGGGAHFSIQHKAHPPDSVPDLEAEGGCHSSECFS